LLLHPKSILGGECVGIFLFKLMPEIEIGSRSILWKFLHIARGKCGFDLEADKLQVVVGEESGDLPKRDTMFLDMEKHVATFAEAEEIDRQCDPTNRVFRFQIDYFLAEAANFIRCSVVAAIGGKTSREHNGRPSNLAIKGYVHHAAGGKH